MELFIGGARATAGQKPGDGQRMVCILGPDEAPEGLAGFERILAIREKEEPGTRYESRDGFDYITVLAPDPARPGAEKARTEICLTADSLTLVGDSAPVRQLVEALDGGDGAAYEPRGEILPAQALLLFFVLLTQSDPSALGDIEEAVSDLEDEVLSTDSAVPEDCMPRISGLRRQLLALKRYYEALYDLLVDLEENMNGLLDKKTLHAFRMQTNRADRLSRTVANLRDYVTQVREAYQNQLDISLNETMKLFTVITAVFLPLSLIAGWYGMNLKMPEYNWPWAYPALIVVSLAVALICLWYFKRKKWF